MRILMIGAGGVGDAATKIAVERDFFEAFVVADYDLGRAQATVDNAHMRYFILHAHRMIDPRGDDHAH